MADGFETSRPFPVRLRLPNRLTRGLFRSAADRPDMTGPGVR